MKKKPIRASTSFNSSEVAWLAKLVNSVIDEAVPPIPIDFLRGFEDKANAMKLRIAEIRRARDAS